MVLTGPESLFLSPPADSNLCGAPGRPLEIPRRLHALKACESLPRENHFPIADAMQKANFFCLPPPPTPFSTVNLQSLLFCVGFHPLGLHTPRPLSSSPLNSFRSLPFSNRPPSTTPLSSRLKGSNLSGNCCDRDSAHASVSTRTRAARARHRRL
eukprot:2958771-Rhodomonas_salina.2